MEWQPMNTAPKDGTWIMVLDGNMPRIVSYYLFSDKDAGGSSEFYAWWDVDIGCYLHFSESTYDAYHKSFYSEDDSFDGITKPSNEFAGWVYFPIKKKKGKILNDNLRTWDSAPKDGSKFIGIRDNFSLTPEVCYRPWIVGTGEYLDDFCETEKVVAVEMFNTDYYDDTRSDSPMKFDYWMPYPLWDRNKEKEYQESEEQWKNTGISQ